MCLPFCHEINCFLCLLGSSRGRVRGGECRARESRVQASFPTFYRSATNAISFCRVKAVLDVAFRAAHCTSEFEPRPSSTPPAPQWRHFGRNGRLIPSFLLLHGLLEEAMTSSAVVVDCQMNQHSELFARKTTADTITFQS